MHADDMDLVREFAASGSDAAFATLVRRHVNLVYSAALRRLGNAPEAEEVAQNVFIILARKAGSLRCGTILSGWLYQTAQLTAANFQRAAIRRQHREQEAYMQFSEQSEPNASWHRLSPLLEEAMARLGQKERDAIVLRFFENRTVREVADALGLREGAAQKRVNRATDKLRDYFVRRGVQVSTAALLASLGTHAVQAAPAELASKIAATAALKGAAGGGSTLTLIKGALKIMAWTKAKSAAVAATAVILATGTTTVIVKHIAAGPAHVSNEAVDDSFFEANGDKLASAPPNLLILRESRSARTSGPLTIGGYRGLPPGAFRMSGQGVSFDDVINTAFGSLLTRIVYAADPVGNKFDFLVTVPEKQKEALQAEIARQFGLTARQETRTADALLLKVKTPGAPGLLLEPRGKEGSQSGQTGGRFFSRNMPIGHLAALLEMKLRKPVLDQTGLAGNYTYEIPDTAFSSPERLSAALLNQLGLELVPGREPVEMLVVEKVK